jgi:ribosome-associated protein
MATSTPIAPAAVAHLAARLVQDLKAQDVVLLDLQGVTDMTDYFLIATGTSDTHVRSIAQHVEMEMKKAGAPANHVEGAEQGRWALLDFVDVVVHVFHPTLRNFYQLERLWGDAREVPLDGAAPPSPAPTAAG